MSQVQTGNQTHDATVNKSYGVLQAALVGSPTQASVNSAYITHYRTCLASAKTNNCGLEPFQSALRSLGVQA